MPNMDINFYDDGREIIVHDDDGSTLGFAYVGHPRGETFWYKEEFNQYIDRMARRYAVDCVLLSDLDCAEV